jgi:uncharacterized protein (DUF58 family)
MDWGAPPKSFYSRRAAAALAYMSLNRFDRLAITPFSDRLHGTLGPTRGRGSVLGLLDFLRAVEYRGETNVDMSLQAYSLRTRRRGDLLVLVSDLLPPNGYQAGLRALLERGWQVLVVHLFDPAELTPTLRGDLELIDQETDERIELTPTAALFERYRHLVGTWAEEVASFCKRRGIDYVRVQTDWPFETLVLGYMEQLGLVQ